MCACVRVLILTGYVGTVSDGATFDAYTSKCHVHICICKHSLFLKMQAGSLWTVC